MARSLARPFKEQIPDAWEEFDSAAGLALVESARKYEPTTRVKFSTFARHKIVWALRTARIERIRRAQRELPGADLGDGVFSVIEETIDPRRTPFDAFEEADAFEHRIRGLPPAHAEALRLTYRDGLTHAEAGRVMGVVPTRVTAMIATALHLLGDRPRDD